MEKPTLPSVTCPPTGCDPDGDHCAECFLLCADYLENLPDERMHPKLQGRQKVFADHLRLMSNHIDNRAGQGFRNMMIFAGAGIGFLPAKVRTND